MNQVVDPELQTQPAQQEESTTPNLSVLRLQITFWLVLTGVLAIVGTIGLIALLLWIVPSGLPIIATLELAVPAIGIIGTLVGTAVGYLLVSMGKEQAEKRAEKNLAMLLENLQKGHELNGTSPL
jgi:membrane protein implicated in regulation of membrane protease activity